LEKKGKAAGEGIKRKGPVIASQRRKGRDGGNRRIKIQAN